jgi:aspartate-semialdehyde dehydrogenase
VRKIVDSDIQVVASCVRVPTFVGVGETLHIELAEPLPAAEAKKLLRESPGIMLVDRRDEEGAYVTPVESVGEWATFVSRVRDDPTVSNGLAMWIVSDDLRNGGSLLSVQVAELLLNRGFLGEVRRSRLPEPEPEEPEEPDTD